MEIWKVETGHVQNLPEARKERYANLHSFWTWQSQSIFCLWTTIWHADLNVKLFKPEPLANIWWFTGSQNVGFFETKIEGLWFDFPSPATFGTFGAKYICIYICTHSRTHTHIYIYIQRDKQDCTHGNTYMCSHVLHNQKTALLSQCTTKSKPPASYY